MRRLLSCFTTLLEQDKVRVYVYIRVEFCHWKRGVSSTGNGLGTSYGHLGSRERYIPKSEFNTFCYIVEVYSIIELQKIIQYPQYPQDSDRSIYCTCPFPFLFTLVNTPTHPHPSRRPVPNAILPHIFSHLDHPINIMIIIAQSLQKSIPNIEFTSHPT